MKIVVLFTYGYSLKDWVDKGHLYRELSLYKSMVNRGVDIVFLTYGDREDFIYQNLIGDINVIPIFGNFSKPRSKIFQFLKCLFILRQMKNNLKDTALIKTNQVWGGWNAVYLKRILKIPLLVRCGNEPYSFSKLKKRKLTTIFKHWLNGAFTYNNANRIIVATNMDKLVLEESFKINTKLISILPNWVDTDVFKPFPQIEKSKNKILAVGRLVKQKNYELLFESLKNTEIILDIYGDGQMKKDLKLMAKKLNIEVNFFGKVRNDQLPNIYNEYKVYALTSNIEGNPKTLIEAMACGCGVVATNVQGINNLIKNKFNGLLVEKDHFEIKMAILKLINDSDLNKTCGKNARGTVINSYSLKKYVHEEYTIINKLIKKL